MVALFSLTGVLSVADVDDVDAIKTTSSSSATQANIGSDGCGDRGGTSLLFVIVAVAFVTGEAASVVTDARGCAPGDRGGEGGADNAPELSLLFVIVVVVGVAIEATSVVVVDARGCEKDAAGSGTMWKASARVLFTIVCCTSDGFPSFAFNSPGFHETVSFTSLQLASLLLPSPLGPIAKDGP